MVQSILRAVRSAHQYLLAWSMECEQSGEPLPPEVSACAAHVRKARQTVEQLLHNHPDDREIGFYGVDPDIVVSCLVYEIAQIDLRAEAMNEAELATAGPMLQRRSGLARVATVLARREVRRLPVRDARGGLTSPTVRSICVAIQSKLAPPPATAGGVSGEFGIPFARNAAPRAPVPAEEAPEPDEIETALADLIEFRLTTPRLQGVRQLDLAAYGRSLRARDFRLALLHLASVLDGVLIDHALPRRRELGLMSAPDTWRTTELVVCLLGDEISPVDSAVLEVLGRARMFAYPALQLAAASRVDENAVEQAHALVVRVQRLLTEQAESARETTPS